MCYPHDFLHRRMTFGGRRVDLHAPGRFYQKSGRGKTQKCLHSRLGVGRAILGQADVANRARIERFPLRWWLGSLRKPAGEGQQAGRSLGGRWAVAGVSDGTARPAFRATKGADRQRVCQPAGRAPGLGRKKHNGEALAGASPR
ncbi:MAG: hypothetical protein OZSIB_3898 [Candidatus Ozemobacter sibiricus]|uniref:Uncharacterized protein n=1 Tax=Candidatus Ozemobacter sibiricus TaxID=2268124 RepID=A0A367ZNP2_9BACT|nr:MAG: hypothetical protein OZSIB_3898 [Candidatus Ozemobacter sibiricus]